jgi:hypothetical protein
MLFHPIPNAWPKSSQRVGSTSTLELKMNKQAKFAINIALITCAEHLPFLDQTTVDMVMLLLDLWHPDKDAR